MLAVEKGVDVTPTESFIEVAGGKIQMLQAGTGRSLVVLHHDIGNPGWLPFYDTLSGSFAVHVASHPGFGRSERPEWMRSVRDMAIAYEWLLQKLSLEPVVMVGLGFGGWIAVEMATMCRHSFSHLILVNPMGFQPRHGEILDQFLINTIDYVRSGFESHDKYVEQYTAEPTLDQLEQWEINREMTSRIAYKPYMFDQTLPQLSGGITTPTLIIWGTQNRIVPRVCGEQYRDAIPGARLELIPAGGHFLEMEKPAELAKMIQQFVIR
jgi:pimeloyl-ACP methyl ester carboxylesterase